MTPGEWKSKSWVEKHVRRTGHNAVGTGVAYCTGCGVTRQSETRTDDTVLGGVLRRMLVDDTTGWVNVGQHVHGGLWVATVDVSGLPVSGYEVSVIAATLGGTRRNGTTIR